VKIPYWDEALYGFSWNDDVSQFDPLKLSSVSNPFAWHINFFRHVIDSLKQIFCCLRKMQTPAARSDRRGKGKGMIA